MLATQERQKQRTILKLIEQPGLQMPLGIFFDKWIVRLYGIEKHKYAVQRGIDFRTGHPINKTWKQTCYFELQQWGCSHSCNRNAKNWGADWESAPEMPKRLAYFMDQILEDELISEQQTRQETRNHHD